MSIRAVVWDIDDTIFDYTTADRAGMRSHLRAEGLLERYGTAERALALWREVTNAQWRRFEAGGVSFEDQRRDRVRIFLDAPLTDAQADDWFHRYVAYYQDAWALFPDVLPALDALAGSHRHAVLSNSSLRNQDHKLRVLGVHDRFESVLCAAELGIAKPAAEAFHAACDALRLPAHEVAYVGDQPEIDAVGAEAAGLFSVWLDRGLWTAEVPPGLRRITSLAELPALLRADTRFGAPSTFG